MKYQIMNFMSGRQRHYDVNAQKWENSTHRFSGEFEATQAEALAIMRKVMTGFRKRHFVSYPKLYILGG